MANNAGSHAVKQRQWTSHPHLEDSNKTITMNSQDVELQYLRDLRYFKATQEIERSARYPDSLLVHLSIVALIVVLETCANMYFFAKENPHYEIGWLLQALLISLTNVGVAFLVGNFPARYVNHRRGAMKAVGVICLIAFFAFTVFFNLLTAHYRDLLATSPEITLQDSLAMILKQPLQMSFNSLMLFTAGLTASLLGLYMGYRADDPYPGYGAVERRYLRASRAREATRSDTDIVQLNDVNTSQ
jgi:hypothetical protein